jgi:hypothetical protein
LHLIIFTGNSIRACWALGRPTLAFEADLKILDEVLKPLLDVESSKNIVRLVFNLDDDFPIQKKIKINLNYE